MIMNLNETKNKVDTLEKIYLQMLVRRNQIKQLQFQNTSFRKRTLIKENSLIRSHERLCKLATYTLLGI